MSIDVGKVVIKEAYDNSYTSGAEENVSVRISEQAVELYINADKQRVSGGLSMTPEQAIELGQMLLKAAEVQSEYAAEATRLQAETEKLATKYKDMISGLGLETEVDIVDARGTFKVIEAS